MTAAAVTMFDRPLTSEQEPGSHICEAVSTDDDVIEFSSIGALALPSAEDIVRLQAGLPIVLDGSAAQEYLPDEMKNILGEKKIEWLSSFGLRSGNQLMGTLMLMNSSFDELDEAASSAFTTLADQIGVILHSRQLLEDSRQAHAAAAQLVDTNRAISITSDNGEMVWVIFRSMKEFVTLISMFSFDEAATERTRPSSVQLDALAIQETSQRPAIVDKLDKNNPAVESFVKELLSGKAIVIDSTHQLKEIMGVSVTHLNKLGVQSFIATGLLVGSRLLGFLLYGIPDNTRISIAQMDSFVSVADQVAITTENRRLFQVTGQSLQEATTLYNANRDLLSSQDGMEVLNSLRNYLAPNARELTLYSIGWDEIEESINSIFVYSFISDVEGLHLKRQLLDMFEGENAQQLKAEWENRESEVYFYEDLDATEGSNLTLATAYVDGARSMAILPVFEDDRLINQVNIVFDAPRIFDQNTRRFFNAIRSQLSVVLQNHRLLLDTRTAAANLGSQVRVLRTINQLAATLSTTQDEQVLMNSTCEALFNALDVDYVSVAMLGADQKTSFVTSEYPDKDLVGPKTIEDSPIYVKLHGQDLPIAVNDVQTDAELDDDTRALANELGIKSMLLLPLFDVRVNFIGAIRLDVYKKQPFTDDMVGIARTITSQISTSLQSIRLLHDTQYRARQMEQIAGFSQSIQATLDIETLLEVGVTNVMEIISSHHMAIIFHDAAKGSMRCVAWQEDKGTPHVDLDSKIHVKLDGTTAGLVRNRPAAFRSNDLAAEEGLRYTFQDDIRSVLSLPIFTRGVLRGIVEIGNRLPGAYVITDYAVFQQIISQLAVGIENGEAYAQSQRLAQRKALVNEISSHLQQRVGIEQILEVTMNELGNALGARRARIRLATEIPDKTNGSKG